MCYNVQVLVKRDHGSDFPLPQKHHGVLDFKNLRSSDMESPLTALVIPSALSSKALSDLYGSSKHATTNRPNTRITAGAMRNRKAPFVISSEDEISSNLSPNRSTSRITAGGKQNRRPPSVTSSDDYISSNMSSDSSLSTQPPERGRLLTPIYGPGTVPGIGRTSPVPLPPQTPGTGRMNIVDLPPTQPVQRSQSTDSLPPSAKTSTRGRGTSNRGKK